LCALARITEIERGNAESGGQPERMTGTTPALLVGVEKPEDETHRLRLAWTDDADIPDHELLDVSLVGSNQDGLGAGIAFAPARRLPFGLLLLEPAPGAAFLEAGLEHGIAVRGESDFRQPSAERPLCDGPFDGPLGVRRGLDAHSGSTSLLRLRQHGGEQLRIDGGPTFLPHLVRPDGAAAPDQKPAARAPEVSTDDHFPLGSSHLAHADTST